MDVKKTDIKKSKRAPIIAAAVFIMFMLAMIIIMIWAKFADPEMPFGFLIFSIVLFGSMIAGVILALRQRLKEIEGGELNEASKY